MNRYEVIGAFTNGEAFAFTVAANNIKEAILRAWEHPAARRHLGGEVTSIRKLAA